jgi:flagella basal body P-ring formation protein FlgA
MEAAMNNNRAFGRRSFVAALLWMTAFAAPVMGEEPDPNWQVTSSKTVERFVPTEHTPVASIEMRDEATVATGDVTLKQICRWPDADAEAFAAVADLVVLRLGDGKAFGTLSIDQLQGTLRDAGVNPSMVNFSGAATCTVSRTDVKLDEGDALRAWVGMTDVAMTVIGQQAEQASKPEPAGVRPESSGTENLASAPKNTGDLRARLIEDAATRLNLPVDTLQVDFRAEDRKLLGLAAPFEFAIEPQRYGDLGDTSWLVTITANEKSQRVRIVGTVRAWSEQLVLTRPLNLRQTISEADFEVKRVLAEKLSRDPLATKDQAIGQQAARELRVGTILTGKMLAPVEFARAGQLVTVLMRRGGVEVKSVATALQNGAGGDSIKVKNETTNQVFQVTLTGQQTAVLGASDPVASVAE